MRFLRAVVNKKQLGLELRAGTNQAQVSAEMQNVASSRDSKVLWSSSWCLSHRNKNSVRWNSLPFMVLVSVEIASGKAGVSHYKPHLWIFNWSLNSASGLPSCMLEARWTISLIPRQNDSLPPVLRVIQNPQEAKRNDQSTGVHRRDSMYLGTEFVVWLLATCSLFISFVSHQYSLSVQ